VSDRTEDDAPAEGGLVAATISPAVAAARRWTVIVVGGGPAGAAVATRLAARDEDVLLVDAATMPRPKLCGCCLSARAMRELATLQAFGGPRASATESCAVLPLERVIVATPTVSAMVPLSGGGVISRESLDAAGVRSAITAGAEWLPDARVMSLRPGPRPTEPLVVEITCGGILRLEVRSDVVVIATGLPESVRCDPASPAAPRRVVGENRIGLGTTLSAVAGGPPAGELVMAVGQRGYCGVVRLEDGRLDLAAAIDRRAVAVAGSPAAAVAGVLAEAGGDRAARLTDASFAAALARATFRGTPPLTRSAPVVAGGGRVFRVGDAAGYVEPFTGEGIGWALESARLFDEAFADGFVDRPTDPWAGVAARYASLHARHFAAHHGRCRRVALAVRRPWLVASAIRLARLSPALAARVAPLVVGAASLRKPRA